MRTSLHSSCRVCLKTKGFLLPFIFSANIIIAVLIPVILIEIVIKTNVTKSVINILNLCLPSFFFLINKQHFLRFLSCLSRTGGFSKRKLTGRQRRTRRSFLQQWRAAWLMIFHQSPPQGPAAGELALLILFPTSNTRPKCLFLTRLSWTSCAKGSISQIWMR